jgi:hypothetical protein
MNKSIYQSNNGALSKSYIDNARNNDSNAASKDFLLRGFTARTITNRPQT